MSNWSPEYDGLGLYLRSLTGLDRFQFPEAEVDAIVTVLRDVRSTAIPLAEAV
jgi:hypothetical protein